MPNQRNSHEQNPKQQKLNLKNEGKNGLRKESVFLPRFSVEEEGNGEKREKGSAEEMQERRTQQKCGRRKLVPKYGRSQSWWKRYGSADLVVLDETTTFWAEVWLCRHGRHAELLGDSLHSAGRHVVSL